MGLGGVRGDRRRRLVRGGLVSGGSCRCCRVGLGKLVGSG